MGEYASLMRIPKIFVHLFLIKSMVLWAWLMAEFVRNLPVSVVLTDPLPPY